MQRPLLSACQSLAQSFHHVHRSLLADPPSGLHLRHLYLRRCLVSIPTLPLHPAFPLYPSSSSSIAMIMPTAFAQLTVLVPPVPSLPFPLPTHPCPTIIASAVVTGGIAT